MSGALIPFVIAAVAIPLFWYFAHQAEKKRQALARSVAASAGLHVEVGRKGAPSFGFEYFDRGHSQEVKYHMWPAGTDNSVFHYKYDTGSGKNKRTYESTCTLVELPFDAPHLRIGREGFLSGLGRMIGLGDIEIESPEFNDLYRVRCEDERFAVTLLDHHMIGWMLTSDSGQGSISFEMLHNMLLCVCDELPIEQMPGFLEWSQGIREQLPAVLPSLYPLSR